MRGRVKPSKPMSALAVIVGIVFIGIGVFLVIPNAGIFGVFWTLVALAITVFHVANLCSVHGAAYEVVDFDRPSPTQPQTPLALSTEQRLAKLDDLKRKGLVSDEEYAEQRKRILDNL